MNQKTSQEIVELQEKLIEVKRVSKVIKGGRVFSFTALIVVGDMSGRVGFGKAKAKEVSQAIQKARDTAFKNMIRTSLNEATLFYPISERFGATTVYMQPASEGTGVIASKPVRAVLELCGVKDVLTKCYGSRNSMNMVRATFNALKSTVSPSDVLQKRGLSTI